MPVTVNYLRPIHNYRQLHCGEDGSHFLVIVENLVGTRYVAFAATFGFYNVSCNT
jgi:hypothetical protein